MVRVTMAVVLGAAALAAAGCGGDGGSAGETTTTATTQTTTTTGGESSLAGSVGPGFDISLDRTEVAAGTYSLVVDDQSSSHNFHLTGPGVDVATDVGGEEEETFTVDLQAGTYAFVCDPHSGSMNGTLTVK